MSVNGVCQSCGRPKHRLRAKRSYLIKDMTLVMCEECISAHYEPRWIIILVGRQSGVDAVKRFLVPRQRYIGDPIIAADLLK